LKGDCTINYLPAVSWGVFGAASVTERASFFASYGLFGDAPSPAPGLNIYVLVSGVWKQIAALHVLVSGAWKELTSGNIKALVSGTWKSV
jgi:hypothetical protein